jgi:hypothetical protein
MMNVYGGLWNDKWQVKPVLSESSREIPATDHVTYSASLNIVLMSPLDTAHAYRILCFAASVHYIVAKRENAYTDNMRRYFKYVIL